MTAGDMPLADYTYKAGVSFAAAQFYAVYVDGNGVLQLATSSYPMMGIMQDTPAASARGAVRELGHSKAVIATGCTVGDPLKVSSTAGQLTTGTLSSDVIVAVALETATATGQIIEVALTARTAQGVTSRTGHLEFNVALAGLTTSAAVITGIPMGFTGVISDMYVTTPVASGTSSGHGTLTLKLTTAATPRTLGGLAVAIAHDTCTANAVITSTKTTVTNNTFVPTDTLEIYNTSGTTFASDTGTIQVHIITN